MNDDVLRAKSLELALQFVGKDENVEISRNKAKHFILSQKLFQATTDIYAFLTDGKSIKGQYGVYPATDKDN